MSNENPQAAGPPYGPGGEPNAPFGHHPQYGNTPGVTGNEQNGGHENRGGQNAHTGYGPGTTYQEGSYQGYGVSAAGSQPYGAYGTAEYGQPGQPYGAAPYGQPMGGGYPQGLPYASWGARVAAYLIDGVIPFIPMAVLSGVGLWMMFKDSHEVTRPDGTTDLQGFNGAGFLPLVLAGLVALLFSLWNRGFRQGKTGQSIGKKLLHISVIDEQTGRPAGAGAGAGRFAIEFIFSIVNSFVGVLSLLDLLWPLWDNKNQALHDKAVHTVVVKGDVRS